MSSNEKLPEINAKAMVQYMKDLTEMEAKAENHKKYINKLKSELKDKQMQIDFKKTDLKRVKTAIGTTNALIAPKVTELMAVETENKIRRQQIESYEQKISNLRQKILELVETRRQEIDKFSEEALSFCENYGPVGVVRIEGQNLEKRIETLKEKRLELENECKKYDKKLFESVLEETKTLNDKITSLRAEKAFLQRDNNELKAIESSLKSRLKDLKENESKELNDLRKELQTLQEMEKNQNSVSDQSLMEVKEVKPPISDITITETPVRDTTEGVPESKVTDITIAVKESAVNETIPEPKPSVTSMSDFVNSVIYGPPPPLLIELSDTTEPENVKLDSLPEPAVSGEVNKKRAKNSFGLTQNKRIGIKNVSEYKTEEKTKLWELIRKRDIRKKDDK